MTSVKPYYRDSTGAIRDTAGNYLGTAPRPVLRQGTTLRNVVANPPKPTTLRQIVPTSGRTRRQYGRRLN